MISVDFPQVRHVPLTGASNFRDLGGYSTATGQTRWGRIYRADALTVDLRFHRELEEQPNIFKEHATVQYHHNPVLIEDPAERGAAETIRTLTAAGVAREDVVQDYILSNEYLAGLMQKLSKAFREKGIDPEPILENLRLREEYLAPMLDWLQSEFGGIDEYLQAIGVTPDELAVFRREFHVER